MGLTPVEARAELLQQVSHKPIFLDLAIGDAHDPDARCGDRLARRRDAQVLSFVGVVERRAGGDLVPVGHHIVNGDGTSALTLFFWWPIPSEKVNYSTSSITLSAARIQGCRLE